MPRSPWRWFAIFVFIFSSMLNYLDRQLLAAVAPSLRSEFHLSNHQYGQILSIFSIVYAFVAPAAGWFIDRVGLNAGVSIAVLVWSLAGASTGITQSVSGLIASRTALGISEAAGIPGFGKANSVYLAPSELALGTAFNQVGISLGLMAAPLDCRRRLSIAWLAICLYHLRSARTRMGAALADHLQGDPCAAHCANSLRRKYERSPARPPHLGTDRLDSVSHVALHPMDQLDHALLRRAMAHVAGRSQQPFCVDSADFRRARRIFRRLVGLSLDSRRNRSLRGADPRLLDLCGRVLCCHGCDPLDAECHACRRSHLRQLLLGAFDQHQSVRPAHRYVGPGAGRLSASRC